MDDTNKNIIKLAELEEKYFRKTGKNSPLRMLIFIEFDTEFQIEVLKFALRNNATIDVEYDKDALDKINWVVLKRDGMVIRRIKIDD